MREAQAQAATRGVRAAAAAAAQGSAEELELIKGELRAARAEAASGAAEAARASASLQERTVQVAILSETVQAMQGGEDAPGTPSAG